jgi:hypothetical protein
MTTKPRSAIGQYAFKALSKHEIAAAMAEEAAAFTAKGGARVGSIGLAAEIAAERLKVIDLARRIDQLEAEIANFQHKGPFRSGERYAKNNLVQHDGGCWMAQATTTARPGTDNTWRLVAKRAKDFR